MSERYRLKAGTRAGVIDGEGILISFETGKYASGMRGAAADLVEALERGPQNVSLAADVLAGRYAVADRDGAHALVRDFFSRLETEHMVEPTDEAAVGFADGDKRLEGFVFGFTVGAEMADVITLDPVHEVSPEGWPSRSDA